MYKKLCVLKRYAQKHFISFFSEENNVLQFLKSTKKKKLQQKVSIYKNI